MPSRPDTVNVRGPVLELAVWRTRAVTVRDRDARRVGIAGRDALADIRWRRDRADHGAQRRRARPIRVVAARLCERRGRRPSEQQRLQQQQPLHFFEGVAPGLEPAELAAEA